MAATTPGIGGVDWAAASHAYGPATDVPRLLAALRSPHAELRAKALDGLYNRLRHQGTLYPAAAVTAPFLLELAADPELPDRHEIVALVAHLAVGYDEEWLPRPSRSPGSAADCPPPRSSSRTAGLTGWQWRGPPDCAQRRPTPIPPCGRTSWKIRRSCGGS
jgi:hypothetical protein